ncbi:MULTISPECIES: 2-amino-4-hydroxy-6-hydroxymethyldihydropteridine diphosphokinase [unclassified Microbacterium]|uniref:2-amino-4-hydroxy-6- hydroxymethyldihydropteridine diphosphokinase n=1 Tax=unclassified Microbacterium TaxID=2609290 RepID=UPI003747230B
MSAFADEVAATGRPRPAVAVVALGANLGDREAALTSALTALAELPLTDLVRASAALETIAVTTSGADADRPRYLNAVALVATRLAPSLLLEELHRIEADHGRERRERWGDRTLDLDLVSYGDIVSDDDRLVLPHPRAGERDFVMVPWLEVDAGAHLPRVGAVSDVLARLQAAS